MLECLPPPAAVLPLLPAGKESASGVGPDGGIGVGLVLRQPLHPRLAVVRKRVADAASRYDEIFGVETAFNAVRLAPHCAHRASGTERPGVSNKEQAG